MESSCSGSVSGSPTNHASSNKNLKHFKKAFIVEYERIESHHSGGQEDSQESTESSCHSTTTTTSTSSTTSSQPTSFANSISIVSKSKTSDTNYFKRKLDLYEDEKTTSDDESDSEKKTSLNKTGKQRKSSESDKSKSKSKQKSKSNKEDKNKKKVYCICKSTNTKRFMIACDNCDDWFHGDCVGVTQSLSKKIKAFFCHLCRYDKPKLKIKYKSKYDELNKNLSKEKAQQLTSTHNDESFIKFYKETQTRLKKESELLKEKTAQVKQKSESKPEVKLEPKIEVKNESKFYGRTNVSGEDIENFMSAITKLNDTSNLPQQVEPPKTDHDYTAKPFEETESNINTDTGDEYQDETESNLETESERDEKTDSDYEDSDSDGQLKSKKPSKKQTKIQKSLKIIKKQTKPSNKIMKQNLSIGCGSSRPRRLTNGDEVLKETRTVRQEEPGQCLGPECINQSIVNSKYCSHECGMRLAKNRLVAFLKDRFDNYNESECLSDKLNITELERINTEISMMKKKLVELEHKHAELDQIIERAKDAKINPNVEKDREKNMDSNETEIYCVSCGIQCSEKHALKHMEKCFNKIESQAFFASFHKSHLEGQSMFCDNYNPQNRMYCKRLKVMCPEHEKEKKINDDEVCGYPLVKPDNILEDCENGICLAPKRSCSLHFKWEKLRRACIDLEKLRTWLKLEELAELKRVNETALNQRKDLFSILLHKTTLETQDDFKSSEPMKLMTDTPVKA